MSGKQKHKIVRSRSKLTEISREDENTFFHPSTDPERKGEDYMVYHEHENRDRWLCDCMHFTMNVRDANSPTPDCKHIRNIKAKYDIQ